MLELRHSNSGGFVKCDRAPVAGLLDPEVARREIRMTLGIPVTAGNPLEPHADFPSLP